MVPLGHYLILSAILFATGTMGVFLRRNVITVLLSIEVMLNAVNLAFIAFGRTQGAVDGQPMWRNPTPWNKKELPNVGTWAQTDDTRIGMQLGHSGPKGSTQLGWEEDDHPLPSGNWETIAPSPLPYIEGVNATPREMTRADMDAVIAQFVASARYGREAPDCHPLRVGFTRHHRGHDQPAQTTEGGTVHTAPARIRSCRCTMPTSRSSASSTKMCG